jgi:Acetyltransferase (GNAT) domain
MPAAYTFMLLHEFPKPEIESAWRGFLGRVELPSHYCAPEFFKEPFWSGKTPFAVLALDKDKVVGVVSGIHGDGDIQCGLPCRPQICIDDTEDQDAIELALTQGLMAEAESADLVSVYSWSLLNSFPNHGFRFRKTSGVVMLDLAKGPDALFAEFAADKRRNIRFAIKRGVEIHQATSHQDFLEFYDVYLAWRATSRKEIEGAQIPFDVFERAFVLNTNRLVLLARHSGKVIATNSFRFHLGGLFESAGNHSRPEFIQLKPNELLQWRGIEWACHHNLRRHSLGGTHLFLQGFGNTLIPVYRYRLDRTLFRRHDSRESMSDWARAWLKKMPKPVERKIRRVLGKS